MSIMQTCESEEWNHPVSAEHTNMNGDVKKPISDTFCEKHINKMPCFNTSIIPPFLTTVKRLLPSLYFNCIISY